jgi:hypothetical protein
VHLQGDEGATICAGWTATATFGLVLHLQGDESMCMASRQTPLRCLAWFGTSRATSELYCVGGHRYKVGKGCASPG